MDQNLRIHRRGKDRALLLQLVPQLGRVREIAVVRECNVAATESYEDGLRVFDRRGPGRAISRVPNSEASVERTDSSAIEPIRDESHLASDVCAAIVVDGDNPSGLLAPVLQRVQA